MLFVTSVWRYLLAPALSFLVPLAMTAAVFELL